MKFASVVLLLVSTVVLVAAQDCEHICNEQNQNLIREKDELWHSREAIIKEKDEIWHHREAIIKEKDELWHSREAIIKEKDEIWHEKENLARRLEESGSVANEVVELRHQLEKQAKDMEHYQTVAQDNQKYMMEYKNALASQRDRAAKLDISLKEANAKIDELEAQTIFKKLQLGFKSLTGGFKSGKEEF